MPQPTSPVASAPMAEPEWSRPDNRFLPIRACDLTAALGADAARWGTTQQAVHDFARALEEVIDRETGAFERQVTDAYARFNPDRDTQSIGEAELPTDDEYEILNSQLALLLDKANYEELDDVQIAQAVMRARSRNLSVRVDPSRVELLRIWVRGRGEAWKVERSRWKPWRTHRVSVPVFKRLVVIARLKSDPHVILKLFKDIPEAEAEALLPHAEVMMSWWDRVKLLSTGAGTLGITVSKVLKIAITFAAFWKLAWILLFGLVTLGVRSVLGYRAARITRDWQRTQHLYFQNLGNNASALQSLVAMVKQEEFKEVLLGYLMLQAPPAPDDVAASLGERIERYLAVRFGVEVDFDIRDAQRKLRQLGLCDNDATPTAPSVDEATRLLEGMSNGRYAARGILECS